MTVRTAQHEWVKITRTPVEILSLDGKPTDIMVEGETGEVVGCLNCDSALSDETFGTECLRNGEVD